MCTGDSQIRISNTTLISPCGTGKHPVHLLRRCVCVTNHWGGPLMSWYAEKTSFASWSKCVCVFVCVCVYFYPVCGGNMGGVCVCQMTQTTCVGMCWCLVIRIIHNPNDFRQLWGCVITPCVCVQIFYNVNKSPVCSSLPPALL